MEIFEDEETKLQKKIPGVFTFELKYNDVAVEFTKNPNRWVELEQRINGVKDLMNPISNSNIYRIVRIGLDLYKPLIKDPRLVSIENMSNAWLKMNEIIHHFNILKDTKEIVTFSNCELPGSFIEAIRFNCGQLGISLEWYGSSYISGETTLTDTYGLVKNYRRNWLMDDACPGDMTNLKHIKTIASRLPKKCDFYTSDGGIHVGNDYNNQEALNADLHIGQMICGLLTLKEGGSIVLKIYTWFTPKVQSLIVYCASLFKKFYIHKPQTSRPENSEIYLIGLGYKTAELDLSKKWFDSDIVDLERYDVYELFKCQEELIRVQSEFILERVNYVHNYKKNKIKINKLMQNSSIYACSKYLNDYLPYIKL